MLFVLLAVVVAICAGSPSHDERWEAYKVKFGKQYSPDEEVVRYARWKQTVHEVELHNSQYANSIGYTQGINQFSDMTHEEFKAKMLTLKVPKNWRKGRLFL